MGMKIGARIGVYIALILRQKSWENVSGNFKTGRG